jgi:hypothetical protein
MKLLIMQLTKQELIHIILEHLARTCKKTQRSSITPINLLMMIKGIISIYSENHIKLMSTKFTEVGRSQCPRGLRLGLDRFDSDTVGFESRLVHECLSLSVHHHHPLITLSSTL